MRYLNCGLVLGHRLRRWPNLSHHRVTVACVNIFRVQAVPVVRQQIGYSRQCSHAWNVQMSEGVKGQFRMTRQRQFYQCWPNFTRRQASAGSGLNI